jgi:hypothetical protein
MKFRVIADLVRVVGVRKNKTLLGYKLISCYQFETFLFYYKRAGFGLDICSIFVS